MAPTAIDCDRLRSTARSLLPHRTLPEEVITTPPAGKAMQEAGAKEAL
jgi:hypothetical protein